MATYDKKISDFSKVTEELNKISSMEKYKEDFYKDDDVTFKERINEKKVEEFMNFVYIFKSYVSDLRKEIIESDGLQIPTEIDSRFSEVKSKAEQFYLKGSSNFRSGFVNPYFYIESGSIFFSVETPTDFVDYATVTKIPPGGEPGTPVEYGSGISDGIYVNMPIEVDASGRIEMGTRYTVYLISTSGERISFNYEYRG